MPLREVKKCITCFENTVNITMTSSSFFCGRLFCNRTDVVRGYRSLVDIADNLIGWLILPAKMDSKELG